MTSIRTLSLSVATSIAAALALSGAAMAQLAPNQPKTNTPPPAATTAPPAATAKAATPAAKAKAAASACKGLAEAACKSNNECSWIVPKKVSEKTGKADNPYCRKLAGVAKATADKKAAAGAAPPRQV